MKHRITRQIGKYVCAITTMKYQIMVTDFENYKVTIRQFQPTEEYLGDIICDTAEDADKVIRELADIFEKKEGAYYAE